jgi:hypothetical protein
MMARKGNGVIAAFVLNISARWRSAANFTARPHAAGERASLGALERRKTNAPSVNRTRGLQSIS